MLTFSLDEYGDFEGVKNVKEPIFIAGLIYDDDNSEDTNVERRRIAAYYKSVIEDAETDGDMEFSYPGALHSNGNRERDRIVVKSVKKIVKATLSEFLRRGTYKGKKLTESGVNHSEREFDKRKGRYHIFVILKSDKGKKDLLGTNNNNILSQDDYASNLYFHMADELMSRIIFFNPVIPDLKEITLNIATRSSGDLSVNDDLYKEYVKQGYKPKPTSGGANGYFELTNADIYRTVISKEIINSERRDFKIREFKVLPINYKGNGRNMEFLYLADSVASILSFKVPGKNADDWLHEISDRTKQLTGKEDNLIFGYDAIDTKYARAIAYYQDGDIFSALGIAFEAGQSKGAFAEFYHSLWFEMLEKTIVEKTEARAFTSAVRRQQEQILSNRYNADMNIYIHSVLEKIAERIKGSFKNADSKRILYTLNDNGVSIYSHIGDSKTAQHYFEQCVAYSGMAELEDFLETRNKMAVFYCDLFKFETAHKFASENVSYQELLSDFKKEIHLQSTTEDGYFALGKSTSQLGQTYAFMRDAKAEEVFRRALSNMEEGSANYKITQSYLLHYYLDAGMKEAFLEEETKYFDGNSDIFDQVRYIIEEGAKDDPLFNMKYAFYILLKGMYLFRQNELNKEVWANLQNTEKRFGKQIGKPEWQFGGHPSELIFKYLRLLAIVRSDKENEKLYKKRMWECLTYHGVTEDAIRYFAEAECANVKKDMKKRDDWTQKLCDFLKKNYEVFDDTEMPADGEERYLWAQGKVTYMYR